MDVYENYSESLPQEWIDLAKEAMKSDITKEEFKRFLEQKSQEAKKKH